MTVSAPQAPPAARVASSPRGNAWKWTLVAAAVVAVAVAVTLLVRNEETQSKIAAIEKQMRDKEVADALREVFSVYHPAAVVR